MDGTTSRWPNLAHAWERRATTRMEVLFRTCMSTFAPQTEGSGTVVDLSVAGCQLESSVRMPEYAHMEVRIHIPDLDWTIVVDEAIVQWMMGDTYGLRFLNVRPIEGDRLAWIIARNGMGKHRASPNSQRARK